MSDEHAKALFQLHFEGEATREHKVPASALVQAAQSLQRIINILAVNYEGHDFKQRLRMNREMEKKYAVVFSVPKDGGYIVPYQVGIQSHKLFDLQDIEKVVDLHCDVLNTLNNGDIHKFRRIIPTAHMRRLLAVEVKKMQPPARASMYVSIEFNDHKLLDGIEIHSRIEAILQDKLEPIIHPQLITGRLDGLDFQSRTLKLQLPSGRTLSGIYADDFEPVLLDNPRQWIQVKGEAILNDDNTLKSINNITEISEVDDSPVEIDSFIYSEKKLIAKEPVIFEVEFDPEEELYFAEGRFGIFESGQTREELEANILIALSFVWKQYVISGEDVQLSADAHALRREMQDVFGGQKDAT